MKHEQIDQLDLIDRYVMGSLSAEEGAAFEEHFVDCPQCISRLRTTENFLEDLRLVAAEQAARVGPRAAGVALWHGFTSFSQRRMAWAAVCLLIAVVTATFFVIDYTRGLRDEIARERSLSEQWQRRYEDERQSATSADQAHRDAEAQRSEQMRSLEARLKQQEALRSQPAGPASRLPSEGNLPVLPLTSVRIGEPNLAESVNRIYLPRTSPIFAIIIALEEEAQYDTYRITIFDDRRRPLWKRGGLRPGRQGALSIWLKTSSFLPGEYTLIVEGDKEGRSNEVGNYPFLIVKPR